MSGNFGMVYPLWTYPRGPAELLDRAIGEVGLDHLTIPVVTGRIEQFRLEAPVPPHYFVSEGGWHYPPDLSCYDAGPVKPRPARWFGKRNLLAQIQEHAAKRGIPLIFRIDVRSATTLLEHHPHLRSRNAWGEEVVSAGACVLNPDLRELLHATLDDLLHYEPAGFQLADWAPDLPTDRHDARPMDWQPLTRHLLDICFCPACRQAGTDPDAAARSVTVYLERALENPNDEDIALKARQDEVLNAYRLAKQRDTAAWLQRLAHTHSALRRYVLTDAASCSLVGPVLPDGSFLLLLRTSGASHTAEENVLDVAASLEPHAHGLVLPVWRPAVAQAGDLVRQVSTLVQAGASFFDFEGLDEAPAEAVTWLKQAVRFARRG